MKKHFEITIRFDWCKKCGICYYVCPTGALEKGAMAEPVIANIDKCVGCSMCENLCPDFAIDVKEKDAEKRGVKVDN